MMTFRNSFHTTVAAIILTSSHAVSTALKALGTKSDGDFRPRASVPNAQLEVQEQLKALGFPVNGFQFDLKTTHGPFLGSSPDKQLVERRALEGFTRCCSSALLLAILRSRL